MGRSIFLRQWNQGKEESKAPSWRPTMRVTGTLFKVQSHSLLSALSVPKMREEPWTKFMKNPKQDSFQFFQLSSICMLEGFSWTSTSLLWPIDISMVLWLG
nr:hypothetical 11.7K protein - parsnip yellow fleck virus [Parsnip yellow fleck virus]